MQRRGGGRRARRARRRRRAARATATSAASRCATAPASTSSSASSRASSSGSSRAAASSSSIWNVSRSISCARVRTSPPRAARDASISVSRPRAARSGSRSTPAKRSSASRWTAAPRRHWCACWPWMSTRRAPCSASVATVAKRPLTYARERPFDRDHPRQDQLVVADDEAALHPRLVRAGAHDRRIGTATDEQADRLDQHRLAGPGLARQHGESLVEHEVEPRRSRRGLRCAVRGASGAWSGSAVGQPELRLQDLVEATAPEPDELGRASTTPRSATVSPSVRLAVACPSIDSTTARWPSTSTRPTRPGRGRACGRTACAARRG